MLNFFWNSFNFYLKAGKSSLQAAFIAYLLLFSYCTFMSTEINWRGNAKELGLKELLSTLQMQLWRAPKQGNSILLYIDLDSVWNSIQTCNAPCSTTECDNKYILNIFMIFFRLYPLVEIGIILESLVFSIQVCC